MVNGGVLRKRRRVLARPSSYTPDHEPKVGTCAHCKQSFFLFMMDVDHTLALGLGGPDTPQNRQWLCVACHRIKTVYEARYLFPLHRRLRDLLHVVRAHGTVSVPDADALLAQMVPSTFDVAAACRVLEGSGVGGEGGGEGGGEVSGEALEEAGDGDD